MTNRHLHYIHLSGDTFLPISQYVEDVKRALLRKPDLLVLTEAGESATVKAVKAAAHGYQTLNPDGGDIAFLLPESTPVFDQGGELVIPAQSGSAALGGHGPRFNSFVTFGHGGETVTHTGLHLVTRHAHHASGGPDRHAQQLAQAKAMAESMTKFGRGRHLATGSGDLNSELPGDRQMQAIFDHFGLTTTAAETHIHTPTHAGRHIDWMWTLDRDHRLSVDTMRVLRTAPFNSDHDPLEARLTIQEPTR